MKSLKIKTYFNFLKRSGKIIYGFDNIKEYNKKAYLIIINNEFKEKSKIIEKVKQLPNCRLFECSQENLNNLLEITNCKIVLIKNYELSKAILLENEKINLLREVELIESNTKQ